MGLRWEYTNIRLSANESIMSYDYINLFPSLSYSRRISRPNFWWISNITNQINQYSQFRGNPDLQPEYSDKIEFSYSKDFKGFNLNSSLFLNEKENTIRFFNTIEGNNKIISPQNIGNSTIYGLELYSKFKLVNWWNVNLNATYYLGKYNNIQFLNNEIFSQDYSINNTFKPFDDFSIQANITIAPRRTSPQEELGGLTYTNLAFRKDILNKKGSIILRANDIFNSRLNSALGDINGFAFSRRFISPSSRYLFLTFKYNFIEVSS